MFRLSHATHRDSEFVGKQRKAVTGELTGTATSAGPVNGAPLGGIHRQKLGQGCGRPALLAPGQHVRAAYPGTMAWKGSKTETPLQKGTSRAGGSFHAEARTRFWGLEHQS